jgi:hypothetical protein
MLNSTQVNQSLYLGSRQHSMHWLVVDHIALAKTQQA